MACPNFVSIRQLSLCGAACVWLAASALTVLAEDTTSKPTAIWPATPPGESAAVGDEADTSGKDGRLVEGKPVIRLGNVATPMMTVYAPPADQNTGAAVIVCPGGGYNILAYDLEGSEVCEWLNSIGVTGVLLKYRVPRLKSGDVPVEPLMDVQRTISVVRSQADKLGIKPDRIGVLGFSAGGNLAARASTLYDKRAYKAIDEVDAVSCRPDFSVLVYPAYLYDAKDEGAGVNLPVTKETPPMFLTMAFDDRVGPENILRMGIALKRNEVAAEVHLYPSGGHGYGLRRNEHEATSWPARCGEWMAANGWLSTQ